MDKEHHAALVKFGRIVRQYRLAAGLSQEGLAERANLHRTYVGMIERGEKNLTITNILKLGEALGVSVSQLFIQLENEPSTIPSINTGTT
jgi:transcriptional regulator with XRE-family HTH domain